MATPLSSAEIERLDPYQLMAALGKRVIHPGGRRSTEELLASGDFQPAHEVLDVGCGVGTTAIQVARRFGSKVTAVDVSLLMRERAEANVQHAGLAKQVTVGYGDIRALAYDANHFNRVLAEAVTMFVERPRAARELVRVCKPGGRVLATEFFWRKPPSAEARKVFLFEAGPGMQIGGLDDWVQLYRNAGLESVRSISGPFEMLTPQGFLADEGLVNSMALMGRALTRAAYLKNLLWLMPRLQRAVPYLGYIALTGVKPKPN
jgi:SAM-dependent methyltransferase